MITIDKPGKSKQELLNSLEKLKTDFAKEISEYDVKLSPITDGYNLKGSKKIRQKRFGKCAKGIIQ